MLSKSEIQLNGHPPGLLNSTTESKMSEIVPEQLDKRRTLNTLKILITDDDIVSGKLILAMLKRISKQILIVTSGKEAIETCRDHTDIDLILMDIAMPQMNGYEATRLIRQFNKEVIIIAQTSLALARDIEDALAAGCDDHIPKPISGQELILMIQKYFGS